MSRPFDVLAATARRVLGSEAFLVVCHGSDGDAVVGAAGLTERAVADLERALRDGQPEALQRGYEHVLTARSTFGDTHYGTVHALRRTAGPFDHPELIDTFAAQVALGAALAQRSPRVDGRLEIWTLLDHLVLSAQSYEDLSRALGAVIGPLFGGARIGIMAADAQRNMLQALPGAFGLRDAAAVASHRVSVFDPHSNSARVLSTGLPSLSNHPEGEAGIRQQYVDVFAIERLLSVSLRGVGVLHIANGEKPFNLDDVERAQALAPRVASILELSTTLFRLRRQQRLEESLSAVAVAIASAEEVGEFLPPALTELCAAMEADFVAFVSDDIATITAHRGARDRALEQTILDEADSDPGVRAYVVGPQGPGDPGWAAFYVPVHLGRVRVGTLAALRRHGEPFTRSERDSLTRMANLAALDRGSERYQQQRAELARLQERQRIADDLHDDVAQILFAAQLSLDSLLQGDDLPLAVAERIVRTRGLLIRGDTAIRTVIHRLSSPPSTDLATRLGAVVCAVEDEFAIAIRLQVADEVATVARGLRRPAVDALLKVAREALVNAAKHAGPCNVTVKLEVSRRDRLVLNVTDDGRAVVPAGGTSNHGLSSLRRAVSDQGGSIRVCHGSGCGTKVTASMPLGRPRRDASAIEHPRPDLVEAR